jgi:hypothetical protein
MYGFAVLVASGVTCGQIESYAGSNGRRIIHRLNNTNNVSIYAVFLARPQ